MRRMQPVTLTDQRQATDEQFLDQLRLPGALAQQLAAARRRQDLAESKRLVASHFRTRSAPCWSFYMHGTAWLERDGHAKVLDKAQGLLRHRLQNAWPPYERLDLDHAAKLNWGLAQKHLFGNVSRNTFLPELTTAFALTGKPLYLRKAWELLRGFVEACPFVLDPQWVEDPDRAFGLSPNNAGDLTLRGRRWMDFMHSGALQLPGLMSDADVFWFIKQCWFYALQLCRLCDRPMRRDNHHLGDSGDGPFLFGTMFPEFSFARALARQGRDTFQFHLKNNLFKDGAYAEHCTKYQYHIFYNYAAGQALAAANGLRLFSQPQLMRLSRWAEFIAHACKPDGILVEYGDEFGARLDHFFCTIAAPFMTPKLATVAGNLGYKTGKVAVESPASLSQFFQRWRSGAAPRIGLSAWFLPENSAPRRTPPILPSAQYAQGGFTFLRSAWKPEADFLSISHNTESLPHSHSHWDMMSFVLHTQGQTLIGDPATKLYGTFQPELRGYLYAADSHNCLIMNDDTLKPLKALGHECCWGGYPPRHGLGLFQRGGPMELTELWHDAYAPTRHRRYVLHLRDIGFVLVDLLSRPGLDLRPHQYSQLLHCESNVEVSTDKKGEAPTLRLKRAGAECLILPGLEAKSVWNTWRDNRIAGHPLLKHEKSSKGPWVGELTRRIQGPAVFSTFLLTHPALQTPRPALNYLGQETGVWKFRQHDAFSAHKLALGKMGTLLIASCPYGQPLQSDEFSTDAEVAVALINPKHKLLWWALVRGSQLQVRGKKLVSGGRRQWITGGR